MSGPSPGLGARTSVRRWIGVEILEPRVRRLGATLFLKALESMLSPAYASQARILLKLVSGKADKGLVEKTASS
jgi:hypothetical protein